ncbi:MAG TPA: DNA recombination protein RmuC, partial [Legionellaceae bacterium]|nr:DNA recombination protein RmuC [Legionellaceae bacterium]
MEAILINSTTLYCSAAFFIFLIMLFALRRQNKIIRLLQSQNEEFKQVLRNSLHELNRDLQQAMQLGHIGIHDKITQSYLTIQPLIVENIQRQMIDIREQIGHSFTQHTNALTQHLGAVTEEIRGHLHNLTQQVQHRLTEGFEKTSATFVDVVKRLALIDEAQKKITELSQHVVSLQDVLVDKKARGAFGEVQLASLIANVLPSSHYSLQYTLSNQKRADCVIFLPEPNGNLVIDAKFPLETYQKL